MRGEATSFGRSSIGTIWAFSVGPQGLPCKSLRERAGYLTGQPGKWSGIEVRIDNAERLIMKESDIMGVVIEAAAKKKAA